MFHTCVLDVKLTADDLKKMEICRNISELYAKVFLIFVHLLILIINPLKTKPQSVPRCKHFSSRL